MNILRLSTFSLTLAVAVFALGYANPAFAGKPVKCDLWPACQDDGDGEDPGGLTYTVDLRGPNYPSMNLRGAFEFDDAGMPSHASATLIRGALTGADPFTMKRALDDTDPKADCTTRDADVMRACTDWNDVFNLCGLLGPYDGGGADNGSAVSTNLNTFTVASGDWSITEGGGRRWVGFEFTIAPSFSSDEIDGDLSASLQLVSYCSDPVNYPSCDGPRDTPLIPTKKGVITYTYLTEARIHLGGKRGVTHKADCHADVDSPLLSGSTLVITAD